LTQNVTLTEFDSKDVELDTEEYDILSGKLCNYIGVTSIGGRKFRIKAKQYVGRIVTPNHIIDIIPKIEKINLFWMLSKAYDLEPFYSEDSEYLHQKEIPSLTY
jgi:hypothetical protein